LSDLAINLDNAQNGVELTAKGVDCHLTSDFQYKYLFITVNGAMDVKIKNINMDFEVGLGTQPGTPSTELAPMLTAKKVDIVINPDDVDITLSGSLVAKIAGVFIPLIKSTIIPTIVDQVKTTATTLIDTTIDQDLQLYGVQQEIPYLAGVTFDYAQFGKGPLVTSDNLLEMTVNGTFFNADHVQPSSYTPATFNVRDPAGKQFQAFVTDYTLNTALESGFLSGNTLDITYLLQNFLNVTVTTDNLGVVVPQILTKYGSGKAVGISGKFTKAESVVNFDTVSTATGNLEVTIMVGSDVAIKADFQGINAVGSVNAKNGAIFGGLTTYSLGQIATFETTLGISKDALLKEVQDLVNTEVAELNKNLTAGIVIPEVFGIDISDIEIKLTKGLLEAGISVSASFYEAIARFLKFEAQEIRSTQKMVYAVSTPAAEEFKFLQY